MVQVAVDRNGDVLSRKTQNIPVSSRREAKAYIQDYIAREFRHHGYNEEHGYWWGRYDDTEVSRLTLAS